MLKCEKFTQYIHNGQKTNYEINEFGDVRNIKTGKNIKSRLNRRGYYTIGIYINGEHISLSIHRMVASTFLGLPYTNPLQVNHIDGVKTNNWVNNLEWVSPSENIQHAFDNGLKHGIRGNLHPETRYPDELIIKACEYINEGKSVKETASLTGIPLSYLYTIIRGESRYHIVSKYITNDINYSMSTSRIRYDDDVKHKIFQLFESGLTAKEIKEVLNLYSVNTVYGVTRKQPGTKYYKSKGSTTIESITI